MNLQRILAGGLAALTAGLYFSFQEDDYCHERNFGQESVKVCVYDTKSRGNNFLKIMAYDENTRSDWILITYYGKEGMKLKSISLSDFDKDGSIDKREEWIYNQEGSVEKAIIWDRKEE